MNSTKKERVIT